MTQQPPPRTLPATHTIGQHQCLALSLPAGTELFCISGALQIQTSCLPGLDAATCGLYQPLSPGQSWRAPAHVHLQVCALHGPARLRCHAPPAMAFTPGTPRTTPLWLAAIQRLLRQRLFPTQPK